MKYINRFATLSAFLNSELQQLTGDRIAMVDGFELPILKKKLKTVVTIDPSTGNEVETEELQDVWMTPAGQEEEKVEHKYTLKITTTKSGNSYPTTELSNYNNVYAEIGNYKGNDDYIEDTSIHIGRPGNTSLIVYSYYVFLYDNGIEIPKSRYEIKTRNTPSSTWRGFSNSLNWNSTIDGNNVEISLTPTTGNLQNGHKIEVQLRKFPEVAGTYSFDLQDLIELIIDGEEYYFPPYAQNVIISNQGESPLRNLVQFNSGVKESYPTGISVTYLGDYSYQINIANGTNLVGQSLFAGDFGFHFINDLDKFATRWMASTANGQSKVLVTGFDNNGTSLFYNLLSWNNNNPNYLKIDNNVNNSISNTTDVTYEFDIPVVYFLCAGPEANNGDPRLSGTIGGVEPYTPYMWVANTLMFPITLHFKIVYGEGTWDMYDASHYGQIVKNGTTSIPDYAYKNDSSAFLPDVSYYLPESVTTIGEGAFESTSIAKITLPSSLTSVGPEAFWNTNLTNWMYNPNGNVTLPNGCTWYKTSFPSVYMVTADTTPLDVVADLSTKNASGVLDSSYFTTNYSDRIYSKVIIPEGVTEIQGAEFQEMAWLSNPWFGNSKTTINEIVMPSTLTTVSGDVFNGIGLEIIDTSALTSIPDKLFKSNNLLNAPVFNSSVTSIGMMAFNNALSYDVSVLDLSSTNITSIKQKAFYNNNLKNVTLPSGCTYYMNSFPFDCSVTDGSLGEYNETDVYNDTSVNMFASSTVSGTTLSTDQKDKITALNIPATVTSVSGLTNFSGLCTIKFLHDYNTNNSETCSIGSQAFTGNNLLKSVDFGCGVTNIGYRAFRFDSNLTSVTFDLTGPAVTVGSDAFANTGLTSVTLPPNSAYQPSSFPTGCVVTVYEPASPLTFDPNPYQVQSLLPNTISGFPIYGQPKVNDVSVGWETLGYSNPIHYHKVVVVNGGVHTVEWAEDTKNPVTLSNNTLSWSGLSSEDHKVVIPFTYIGETNYSANYVVLFTTDKNATWTPDPSTGDPSTGDSSTGDASTNEPVVHTLSFSSSSYTFPKPLSSNSIKIDAVNLGVSPIVDGTTIGWDNANLTAGYGSAAYILDNGDYVLDNNATVTVAYAYNSTPVGYNVSWSGMTSGASYKVICRFNYEDNGSAAAADFELYFSLS